MKYLFFLAGLLLFAQYPVQAPASLPEAAASYEADPTVSFSKDLFPIIKTKCNQGADCHGEDGTAFPKYTTYLMIQAKSKKMIKRITNERDPMPPADSEFTLTKEEIAVFETWVTEGKLEN